MDSQKVDMFLMANARYFSPQHLNYIRERLLAADDSKIPMMYALDLKDPGSSLIISLIGGQFGIDRFVIGDVGLGAIKLITCGGFFVWTIADWFLISEATRLKNMEKFHLHIG